MDIHARETPGLVRGTDGRLRCAWAGHDPLYVAYHDDEWGRPLADDRRLLEKICLEGFQCGLSWLTILRKRDNFRRAFAGFDAARLSAYGPEAVERLLAEPGIVRHRGKIEAAVNNARRALALAEEAGSLAAFVWRFEPDGAGRPQRLDAAPLARRTRSPESEALSRALKARGWAFVGPTTVYAFMQAAGLVNDHVEGCWRREAAEAARRAFARPA